MKAMMKALLMEVRMIDYQERALVFLKKSLTKENQVHLKVLQTSTEHLKEQQKARWREFK